MIGGGNRHRLDVVLDDDPTGVQALSDVPVLLDWSLPRLRKAAAGGRPSIHLMTNARARSPGEARSVTLHAAAAARAAFPNCRLVLRGDSTLRGHLGEEYRAVREAAYPERAPVLLLVPALPSAGRVTLDGIHWLITNGTRRALDETEYAEDGIFAYRSARLLEWAEERTGGELPAAEGAELGLERLRTEGAQAVCDAIIQAGAAGRPAACAPDAETLDDLRLIADGLALAEQRDAEVLIRCAPTFAGVLSGTLADGMVEPPPLQDGGLLIVCGSYVSSTTRQLEHLRAQLGLEPIEPDLTALASDHPHAEVSRIARRVDRMLAAGKPALLSTPRTRPEGLLALDAGERIAYGLAAIVEALRRVPAVVIAKGGITSHVVLQEGLRALEGRIAGPVAAGVALWEVESRGRPLSYLVFPGNVGGPSHLTHVVELVTEA